MTKTESKKTEISKRERFLLDTYGYAQLAAENPRIQIVAMSEMYKTFLSENDPLIAKTLSEAKKAITHYTIKGYYDTLPEDKKGEMEDPGEINKNLKESLNTVNEAATLYSKKRQDAYVNMTPSQALDYNSRDGKPIVEIPERIIKLIQKSNKKIIADMNGDEEEAIISRAVQITDRFKINGILNSRLEKSMAKQNLEILNSDLEELLNKSSK